VQLQQTADDAQGLVVVVLVVVVVVQVQQAATNFAAYHGLPFVS